MRTPALLATALTTLLVPATALPCSIALGIFGTAPNEQEQLPNNGRYLVELSPDNSLGVSAVIFGDDGAPPISLTVSPFGPRHVAIDLPQALPDDPYLQVDLTQHQAPPKVIRVVRTDIDDLNPPAAPPSFVLEGEFTSFDQCWGSGLRLYGTFEPGRDDFGLAAHVFSNVLPNDAIERVAVQLHHDGNTGEREFSLFIQRQQPPVPGEEYCLTLSAVDRAGNESPFRSNPTACVVLAPTEPPLPVDGGVIDAGSPIDAGSLVDAGSAPDASAQDPKPGVLYPDQPGCGCSATERPLASTAGLVWLALVLTWIGRRRRVD